MHLTPDQIAAAEISGCSFRPATAAEVQRLSMQRRVFFIDGQPVLGTRGDGFFETVGTLEKLIAEGRQVLRFMMSATPAAPPAEAPVAAGAVASPGAPGIVAPPGAPGIVAPPGAPGDQPPTLLPTTEDSPGQTLAAPTAPAPTALGLSGADTFPAKKRRVQGTAATRTAEAGAPAVQRADAEPAGAPQSVASPPRKPRARRQPAPEASVAGDAPATDPEPDPAPEASSANERPRAAIRPRDNPNPRWMTAGAARRGRATVHWTSRAR